MINQIISNFGKKGTGKSYFTKNILIPKFSRVIVFDGQNEYTPDSKDINSVMRNNFEYVDTITEFKIWIRENYLRNRFKLVCNFEYEIIAESLELIYNLQSLESIKELKNNITLIIEEIHIIENRRKDILYRMFTTGRHRRINIISTAQRFSTVSRELTSQSDILISFKQTESIDIKFASHYNDEAIKLKDLPDRKYMILEGKKEFLKKFNAKNMVD